MRQTALNEGIDIAEKDSVKFHKAFLNQIKKHGRMFEFGLARDYKLATQKFFTRMLMLPPKCLSKGKLDCSHIK